MKLQGQPGRVVQKRVKKQGRYRLKPIFKFDSKGFAEVDESKLSPTDESKLKRLFKVVEEQPKVELVKKTEPNEEEVRQQAKEAGIKSWHVKSVSRLIEELRGE